MASAASWVGRCPDPGGGRDAGTLRSWTNPPLKSPTPPPAADTTPAEDAKERYRQALEQKNERGGHGASGASGGSTSAKGTSAKAGGKREFRRKSG